jgi:hypothetical protein
MQSLLTSFFVSNQIYIVIALLVIASVYLFNYMIKRFKVTINFKKFMFDSPYLKVNTLFTSVYETEKNQKKIINKLIDEKIIDKKNYEKAINISKSISSPPVSHVSPVSPVSPVLPVSPPLISSTASPPSASPPSISPPSVSPVSPPSVSPVSPPSVSPVSPPSVSPVSPPSGSSSSVSQSPTITSANK